MHRFAELPELDYILNMKTSLSSFFVILLFFNMTTTMNTWLVGRVSLWILLILSFYILAKKFQIKVLPLFIIVVLSNPISDIYPSIRVIYQISLATIFLLTGYVCYGDKPQKLRKILVGCLKKVLNQVFAKRLNGT